MGPRGVTALIGLALGGCGRSGFDLVHSVTVDAQLTPCPTCPATCRDVPAGSPSGDYMIETGATVYCEMETSGGGWARVADIDPRVGCPGDWVLHASPLACRNDTVVPAVIRSAELATPYSYSEVMGYALAYQKGTTDGFAPGGPLGIDEPYVDGMSITYRDGGLRRHVWTYAVGWSNTSITEIQNVCPCRGGPAPEGFVGAAYVCASGHDDQNQNQGPASSTWYVADPLYDGTSPGTNCDTGGRFLVTLPAATASPLEARLMIDQEGGNEDIGVYRMELFVR